MPTNRLDLPNRCLAPIEAQQSDGTAYTDVCCRPLGHPTGHMSLAVDDRKEAKRRARERLDDGDAWQIQTATGMVPLADWQQAGSQRDAGGLPILPEGFSA